MKKDCGLAARFNGSSGASGPSDWAVNLARYSKPSPIFFSQKHTAIRSKGGLSKECFRLDDKFPDVDSLYKKINKEQI